VGAALAATLGNHRVPLQHAGFYRRIEDSRSRKGKSLQPSALGVQPDCVRTGFGAQDSGFKSPSQSRRESRILNPGSCYLLLALSRSFNSSMNSRMSLKSR
jgi:hypothetical protein